MSTNTSGQKAKSEKTWKKHKKTRNISPINCITLRSSLVKKSWLFCHASFSHACFAVAATSLYHSQPWSKSFCLHKTKHTSCATLSESLISIMDKGGPNSERDEKTNVKLFLATPHYHAPCAVRMLLRAFRPCSLSLSLPRARLFFCTVNQYCATGSLMIWNFGIFWGILRVNDIRTHKVNRRTHAHSENGHEPS